jgi:hypothetical protein
MSTNTSVNVSSNTDKKQVLSEETKRKISEMRLKLDQKASNRNTKFIKFKDGDHKLLQFVPEKTTEELITYESQPDKPVNRYKFYVHDLGSSESAGELLEWTCSETVAADILKWIEKGYCAMHITRKGADLKTKYDIDPLID